MTIQTPVLATGERRVTDIPIGGDEKPGCGCTQNGCEGTAEASFQNKGGQIAVKQKIRWDRSQAGNAEDLDIHP